MGIVDKFVGQCYTRRMNQISNEHKCSWRRNKCIFAVMNQEADWKTELGFTHSKIGFRTFWESK